MISNRILQQIVSVLASYLDELMLKRPKSNRSLVWDWRLWLLVGTAVWVTRWSVKVNYRLLVESNAIMGEYGRKDHVIKTE